MACEIKSYLCFTAATASHKCETVTDWVETPVPCLLCMCSMSTCVCLFATARPSPSCWLERTAAGGSGTAGACWWVNSPSPPPCWALFVVTELFMGTCYNGFLWSYWCVSWPSTLAAGTRSYIKKGKTRMAPSRKLTSATAKQSYSSLTSSDVDVSIIYIISFYIQIQTSPTRQPCIKLDANCLVTLIIQIIHYFTVSF